MAGRPDRPITAAQPALRAHHAAGIGWVLLRPPGAGEESSGDVDVLAGETSNPRLDGVLAAAGLRRLPGTGAPANAARARGFYVGYDVRRDDWVMLDVVTEVAFGRRLEFSTAVAPELLRRRRDVEGVAHLDPDDAFWHLLLHSLLDKDIVPGPRVARLGRMAARARADGPLARLVDELRPGGHAAPAVIDLVAAAEASALGTLAADLRAAWCRHDRPQVWRRALQSRLARAHVIRESPAEPTGLAVAILGPDGAGKTTLAEGLTRSLPLPTEVLYMGVWKEPAWQPWLRFLQLAPGVRLAARSARLAAGSLRCTYHRRRGRLVVLDRFTYDAALPAELDWRGRVTVAIARRMARAPDAVLVLDAPPEVMYARKGEHDVDGLARDRDAYRRLAADHAHATVIDATLPALQVRARAHRAVWELLAPGARAR
jgi:thymidylate kinase